MNNVKRYGFQPAALWLAVAGLLVLPQASAQISKVVFSEDFSGSSVDSSKFTPAGPFFEGGVGDIAATQHDGILEFTGTVSQQWWAGATLQLKPTFEASPETNVVISVDRVLEGGVGTASRSALWIMDESQSYYVLFADVRGEGGWHYNRKIGETGDVPTGGGTNMDPLDGDPYDDMGLHRMKAVADGSTLKLYLDEVLGTTTAIKFPFRKLIFHVGSYARANGDTAGTQFDNLKVEEVRTATFSATALTLGVGQTATGIKVRIPEGANASQAITLRVVSSNPAAATAVGATAGTLTLTFPAGGSNEQTIDIQSVATGGSRFTLTNDIGLGAGNFLQVTVVPGPGVRLTEDFAANSINTAKWEISQQPFETGEGTYEVVQTGGTLKISGLLDTTAYWDGASLRTVDEYIATADLPLVFEMDRVSVNNEYFGVAASAVRTGVFITTADRSQFVFFGQDLGETGWQVNVNPGNPTGSGTALTAFADLAADKGNHRLKVVANGSEVEVFLDGKSGGVFPFAVSSGIRFEVGAYSRDVLNPDFVEGVFDNVRIENVVPCIGVAPQTISVVQGDTTASVNVTLPKLLNAANTTVTITSSAPGVAIPEGAVNGVLNVVFPPGSASTKSIKVVTTGTGVAQFSLSNDQSVCTGGPVNLTVTPPPVAVLSDNFSAGSLDTTKWVVDEEPLIAGGVKTAESALSLVDGEVKMDVTIEAADWPGFTVWTKGTYEATAASPIAFSIDRTKMEYILTGGTSAKQRTGLWVKDAADHYVFFSDFGSYDGTQASGWQEHRRTGAATDVPFDINPLGGNYIAAFNTPQFKDQKNHRVKAVANGTTVKLYLDGILGTEVPFPFGQGLTFGFGSYVNYGNSAANVVRGYWDNATVESYPPSTVSQLSIARSGGNVVITWTGTGTLQSADALSATTTWTDVTPAPTGSTYTITPAAMGAQKFYRLR